MILTAPLYVKPGPVDFEVKAVPPQVNNTLLNQGFWWVGKGCRGHHGTHCLLVEHSQTTGFKYFGCIK